MQIIINTKYNVGDTVYIADYFHGEYLVCPKTYTVEAFHIFVEEGKQELKYTLHGDYGYTMLKEDNCFGSCAECTKWCEKQNKSL